jgi:ABC-type Mn2+/Zn2+ transport system permease subunit
VGNVLLAALLLGPPVTARLLAGRFAPMVALAAALGAGAGVVGLYVSWHTEVGAGAAIVLVATCAFLVAALLSSAHENRYRYLVGGGRARAQRVR